ncbi:tetratricopeptide repeat protein [Vibrio aestuarianus]|uniref:tetratricopeptide repeat protein n=1 Tax=Vibrio aestuarianus TaxID=28171 RepID=UPI003BB7D863
MKTYCIGLLSLLTMGSIQPVVASSADPLNTIQKKWAVCQYQSQDKEHQVYGLEKLIERNQKALDDQPERPELKVWLAINKGSLAGVNGGLGALSLVKEAKVLLEQVIEQAPETLDGSAYTSLGSLYYQVPGWPIGFGDDEMAEKMLKKALEINPDGIDSNYFYGDFLAEDGRKVDALTYLKRAQQAKARPDRPLADMGRQKEIEKRIGELN